MKIWTPADQDELFYRKAELNERSPKILKQCIDALISHGERICPPVTKEQIESVQALSKRFPNFSSYLNWLTDSLSLSHACHMPLMIPPHLLVGPPGVGKSFILKHVANSLEMSYRRSNLPDMTASFMLTGSSTTWQTSQPGLVARSLEAGPIPWLVFDELDKCHGDERFAIQPTLLSMLEPSTAVEFRDECLDVALDIRPLIFSFTANTLDGLDPALRSRLDILKIRAPTQCEMPAIVKSVDEQLREEDARIDMLFSPLSKRCLSVFPALPAREIKHCLRVSYQKALRRRTEGKIQLKPSDLNPADAKRSEPERQSIGFHAAIR